MGIISTSTASIPPRCGAAPRARRPAGSSSTWARRSRSARSASGTITIPGITDRGVRKMDISVWTQETGWRKVHDDLAIDQAQGSDDYDEPTLVKLDGVTGAEDSLRRSRQLRRCGLRRSERSAVLCLSRAAGDPARSRRRNRGYERIRHYSSMDRRIECYGAQPLSGHRPAEARTTGQGRCDVR